MKLRSFVTCFLSSTLMFGSTVALAQERWDLPTAYPTTNFQTQNLIEFIEEVQNTPGVNLDITLHPNASLFKSNEIKRAIQGGQVQIGEFSLLGYENEWPLFGADSQPFLATSYDDAMKLYQAQKPFLEKKLDEQNMILLYSVPWPPQGLYSVKPIESVDDLRGVKFRSYSPSTAFIAELLQAQPVTVYAPELTQALATGVVEAFLTSPNTGVDSKLWENMDYFYDVQGWLPKNVVTVNKRAFSSLDEATQEAIWQAAAKAEERGWEASIAANQKALETLAENGMQVSPPTAELETGLKEIGETIVERWTERAGDEGKAMLEAYRN